MTLGKAHFWVGIAAMIVFPITGQYMAQELNALEGMADGPRMAYRATHIYLFFAASLNIIMGLYVREVIAPIWAKRAAILRSLIIMTAPLLYLMSFFSESALGVDGRAIATLTTIAILGAILLALLVEWMARKALS